MSSTEKNRPTNKQAAGLSVSKKAYHHGDLRAALIEATRQLVEEKGPDSFSVSEACRRAGVSTAAPYKHFKDKTEMLVATVLEGMDRHRDKMLAALEGVPEGSPERLTAIGMEYIAFALNEPGIFRLKFGGFTDRIADPRLEEGGQQSFGILLTEVAKCLGEPGITDEVRRRGFLLWSFVHGLSFILHDKGLAEKGEEFDLHALLEDVSERMLS
ncbi:MULTISPECIES: TetR/AcrR family transcriptional regulator [unclassified Ruegeria]|uniref:TetR/AcrR family transcriptional regulator n=1 Tax=unclassified Ruegeria TaxID=2625375 RepID=UPI00148966A4|nr:MULTISPECIES: TetR/AcrR family transcriptional regulator [unclassified Ruegeria]NOD78704.1 TetR family transcriptional regulator [Ruegeria sp. HKCCD4332]NOD88827.1 TetR family transcriptional regulator [Ruegeria sp. HKCCD4318]NOE14587.1 TetR family transcriptional regulator [Ruegeria sp. HKCCD4318-2]NOG09892.1 TetR/AcrR family transcriptional regulator [Ruegeria sp. HKCCD4315]